MDVNWNCKLIQIEITGGINMEYVTLYNDVKVPALGIGTFMISPEDAESSVYVAIKGGYRMIDTANAYMNDVICCEV